MTEEERQSIIDEIKEQLLADMVDITKLPKGDATDGASLPVLQHSELVIQELNNFIGVYDIDVERQSADSDIVNIYLKNAAGVVIKTIVTNAATLEQVNTKVAKINESLTLISSSLSAKQDTLISGENIKTINGTSLLGSGNVSISGGSGGGDFNESGTYPNLTAGKATKLDTARTISLRGGATGSVSFDGSKDVDIPVTSINESKMAWNDTYEKNKVSILDTFFRDSFGNKLAYLNPNAIKVEYSRDGGATWLDYGNAINGTSESINKTRLVTHQCGLGSYHQGKRTQNDEETYTDQLRITIDAIDGDVYFSLKKILIYTSGFVDADNKQVKIETQNYSSSSVDTGLWTTRGIYHIVGQPGWSAIPTTGWPNFGYATSGHIRKVRFTFFQNASSVYRGTVNNIAFLAERVVTGGNTLTKTGHLYTMDESRNATFPAAVTATKHVTQGGTSNQVILGDGSLISFDELKTKLGIS